jgi:putative acetyltransferase
VSAAETLDVMRLEDYDDLVAFWTGKEGVELNESDTREAIGRYLERNPGLSLVARDEAGRIVGAILCGHDGRRGYLHHLAVDPACRGRGLGRALVERCLANLRAIGVPRCNIFYMADNPNGKAFWERLGYKTVKFLPLQRPTST